MYQQLGEKPSDSDRLIGLFDTNVLAAGVVAAVNVAWELTQHFEAELAVDPGDSHAEWALELLRPIWDSGLAVAGPGDLPPDD